MPLLCLEMSVTGSCVSGDSQAEMRATTGHFLARRLGGSACGVRIGGPQCSRGLMGLAYLPENDPRYGFCLPQEVATDL
jgi:hypothetical protein